MGREQHQDPALSQKKLIDSMAGATKRSRAASGNATKRRKKQSGYSTQLISAAHRMAAPSLGIMARGQARHSIIPKTKRAKVTYTHTSYVTAHDTSAYHRFRLNSIYDPDYETGGEKVNGWGEMSAIYNKYKVLGSVLEFTYLGCNACAPSSGKVWNGVNAINEDLGAHNRDGHVAIVYPATPVGPTSAYITGITGANYKQEMIEDNQLDHKQVRLVPSESKGTGQTIKLVYTPRSWFGALDAVNMHKDLTVLMAASPLDTVPTLAEDRVDSLGRCAAAVAVVQFRKDASFWQAATNVPTTSSGSAARFYFKVRITYDVMFSEADISIGQV